MTPPESPSSLLERAADLIENLACGATAGPWAVGTNFDSVESTDEDADSRVAYDILNEGDVHWIATLNPSVAPPLVAWLRDSAASCREHDEDVVINGQRGEYCPNENQALDFARKILKEMQ